jgi:hypothetical protein
MILSATAALFVLLQAPVPQQNPQTQQSPKASIEGFVVRAETNESISRARITVSRTAGAGGAPIQQPLTAAMSVPAVTTDGQGRFLVKDLEPGAYTVTAQRNGFARQVYGERASGRGGTPLNLVSGQTMKDVVFRLTPAGAVSGRVSDPTGEPLVGMNVQLLRSTYDVNGQRRFTPVGSAARTNDRGEYRIFLVSPGRYHVSAAPVRSPIDNLPLQPSTNEVIDPGYVLTYYPGTSDISTAASIEVPPGGEVTAIDFTLSQQQLFRIRGRVFDPRTGQFPRTAMILRSSRNPNATVDMFSTIGLNNYNPTNGTFELRDVPRGSYWIRVDAPVNPASPDITQRNIGQVAVDVSAADVDNVVLAFTPGITLTGRVFIEGGASISSLPDYDRMRVNLSGIASGGQFIPTPVLSADGSFKIDNTQLGDYRVSVGPLPPGMYLKEARLGQMDVSANLSISVPVSETLSILLSPNAGQIDGSVVDKDRKPVRGIQAVLIPDRQRDRRDLYRTTTSDQNGHFTIRTVVPGDYKLFAWEDLEPFAYNDPDILRKYETMGATVKVSESSKLTVEAKIISSGQ